MLTGTNRTETRDSLAIWTIVILVLIGVALLFWIGGFYLFAHPEKAASYKFLSKIGKLPEIVRFPATDAPAGEFLNAAKLTARFLEMSPEKISATNAELLRNYIRNYERISGLVPYVVGKFNVVAAQRLGEQTLFPHGAVALAQCADNPDLFIEHVFPTLPGSDAEKAAQFMRPGLPIELRTGDDLCAIIHVERFPDGRLLFTVVPLTYASYSIGKTGAGFRCAPPSRLNPDSPRPLFLKSGELIAARAGGQPRVAAATSPRTKIPPETRASVTPTTVPSGSELSAPPGLARSEDRSTPQAPAQSVADAPPSRLASEPDGSISFADVNRDSAAPSPAPGDLLEAGASRSEDPVPGAGVPPMESPDGAPLVPFLGAQGRPRPTQSPAWPLFAAGEAPPGRSISVQDAARFADTGLPRGTAYLRGEFVVNANGPAKAVLRPREAMAESGAAMDEPNRNPNLQPFLNPNRRPASPVGTGRGGVRVIVEYPPGVRPPSEGASVRHDASRPLSIVDVSRARDGTVNIYAREITAP